MEPEIEAILEELREAVAAAVERAISQLREAGVTEQDLAARLLPLSA